MLLLCAFFAACNSIAPNSVASVGLTQLTNNVHCAIDEKTVYFINDDDALRSAYSLLNSTVNSKLNNIGKINIKQRRIGGKLPHLDWRQERVLLMAMGQKPSAGYSLSLSESKAMLSDGQLSIKINWLEPQAGSVQAQVVTSPCLLIKLPRQQINIISVIDQREPPLQRWLITP